MATTFIDRISTFDPGYQTGDLSIFPQALDTPDGLYLVANNASTVLTQSLPYNSSFLVVSDTSSFPVSGLLSVGTELIYYAVKTPNSFQNLARGFAGSRQNFWTVGTTVQGTVQAEIHNAVKDATINIETDLGTQTSPNAASLNGILKAQETRFLAPMPVFRGGPISGPPPLMVTFQNFSLAGPNRFMWNFGDGGTSLDFAPTHLYVAEGTYTVSLNMITSLGTGVVTKTDYITVSPAAAEPYFYVTPLAGSTSTTFNFVDQTVGQVITSRFWVFGDGNTSIEIDPSVHYISYMYSQPGTYQPSLISQLQNGSTLNLTVSPIIVN